LIPLVGDVCKHYPFGKLFFLGEVMQQTQSLNHVCENRNSNNTDSLINPQFLNDIARLEQAQIAITGLLSGLDCANYSHLQSQNNTQSQGVGGKGMKTYLAKKYAGVIESHFARHIYAQGTRRYAWVYPKNMQISYIAQKAQAILEFELPSGSYATSLLEYIKNAPLYPRNHYTESLENSKAHK
ncbi:tRNA pseudouridine(13) synthase TruD, partial [Helicobacter sp. MIT 14-3879]|uniref:tRNA pseudouridine(13) synthase TruD n=1 Tax=Helicobacter sp. MIT 14-3879 TaxID=2040649 RepID=UPI000E1E71E5